MQTNLDMEQTKRLLATTDSSEDKNGITITHFFM